ncbi:MAG: helix-turn-helix domain-containing protein [Candidatus Micrarchaeia archaeon]
MMMPCEVIVRYYLPAVRYRVAKELLEKHGWTQVEVSKELGITQAAVSKYRSGKLDRKAKEFAESDEIKEAAERIAEKIASGEIKTPKSINKICLLCVSLRKNGKLCELHLDMKKLERNVCDVCLK